MRIDDLAATIPSGGVHLDQRVIDAATDLLRGCRSSDLRSTAELPARWFGHQCDCTAWFVAGQVLALTEQDRAEAAFAILRRFGPIETGWSIDHTSPAVGALLASIVAELFISRGQIQRAAEHAERAVLVRSIPSVLLRAKSALALCHALNGEYGAADDALRSLDELGSRAAPEAFTALLAKVLIASARFDAPSLDVVARELDDCAVPYASHAGQVAATMGKMIQGQHEIVLPRIIFLERRAGARGSHYMVREFLAGMHADALLIRGEARQALALLSERPSPEGHAVCFNMQRSAALLLCGRDHEALAVTDECIAITHQHCLRTLTPLLVRRAVAQQRLGDPSATRTLADAVSLISMMGMSVTPFLTLPPASLGALLDELAAERPDLLSAVDAVRERLAALVGSEERARLPMLTRREKDLAVLLREGQSNAAIAAEFGTSPTTVKSQLRTLYRKLDVNDRDAAVRRLEQSGLFVELNAEAL